MKSLLLALFVAMASSAAAGYPVARGTFIQSELFRGWGDTEWLAEFKAMKEVGMDILIINSVADSKTKETFYPTCVYGYRQRAGFTDEIESCLRAAQESGIKVFIGLNFDERWWKKGVSNRAWIIGQVRDGNAIADELHARYKHRYPEAFYGWYWAWEADNQPKFIAPKRWTTMAGAVDGNVRHLHLLDRTMPVMLCPFMNSELGAARPYADFWRYVFANSDLGQGDIFAPQDGIGSGHLKMDQCTEWFAALKEAVKSKPGLHFWADIETFDEKDWTAAPLGRFVRQMANLRPFVEDYITFAYSHYYSPNNTDPGYQRTLQTYVQTGQLDTQPPTVPTNLKAKSQGKRAMLLTWDAARDDAGICGYNIFRNGKLISRHQVPRKGEQPDFQETAFVDEKPPRSGKLVYEIQAYNFAGSTSEKIAF